jgi:endonuclease-3 related protein
MARTETSTLREQLLRVAGIGPETADSILLYAFGRPVFVVDAYTGRVLRRHRLLAPGAGYEETRRFFEERLPADPALFNDYHAQIVRVGQLHCRTRPGCAGCPLQRFLPGDGSPAPDPPLRRRVS